MPDLPIIPGVEPVILVDHEGNPIDFTSDGRMIVTLSDGTNQAVVDADSLGLTTIETEHEHIHGGRHFICSDYDSDVDITGPKYWHIKNDQSAKEIHVLATLSASLPGLLEIFENPTLGGDGTGLTEFNSKRGSAVAAVMECFRDPTVNADGTRLIVQSIGSDQNGPGGSATGAIGGLMRRANELVLKDSESYLMKFTSGLDNARVSIELDWYEITE